MVWKVLPRKSGELIEQLLISRGIKNKEEREKFFSPKISDYEKDLQIKGITKASERIKKAIKNEELIIAYGDYDVDGVVGAAVLYLGLTSIGAKVLPYIPHREKEGYGLSREGLEFAKDAGASLVITTDTGITAYEAVEYARKLGLELIITDHHQPQKKMPNALIVHSLKFCGAGVSWCLIKNLVAGEKSEDLLDITSIATISDMMNLSGVNRAIVKEGLKRLNQTKRVGLLALLQESGLEQGSVGSYEIGHIIAPRLNAMGRLEHAIDRL